MRALVLPLRVDDNGTGREDAHERAQIIETATPVVQLAEAPTPVTSARPAAAHAEQVPRHGAQRRAALDFMGDVTLERSEHFVLACRHAARKPSIEPREQP